MPCQLDGMNRTQERDSTVDKTERALGSSKGIITWSLLLNRSLPSQTTSRGNRNEMDLLFCYFMFVCDSAQKNNVDRFQFTTISLIFNFLDSRIDFAAEIQILEIRCKKIVKSNMLTFCSTIL
ncbi:hypothetical protein TNIN_100181 [Trichonephila inaurata madagascariensis]|uniref:Uncharacterized protein n=1 Tax=Trichonephila inaurata madagascariensis TaxID=2747483 RepID=A0A8X6WYU9_9ARAC|nr:hypothetical protein TNIN_100181 [Trichonephila inaurata madagascariensis]